VFSASPLKRLAWALAVLTLAMLVLLQGRPKFTNASRPPRFGDPQLALQFVRSVEEVDWILGDAPSPDREVMRIKQYVDFGFIASYAALFLTCSVLVFRAGGWRQTVGIAAGICAIATGVFDVLENRAILHLLDIPLRSTTPAMINAIRSASSAKWTLAAITVVLLLAAPPAESPRER
jgi:hypothetical protein